MVTERAKLFRVIVLVFAMTAFPAHLGRTQEQQAESEGMALSRRTLAARVQEIQRANDLSRFATKEEWNKESPQLHQQLLEMLGLNPMPPRTDLNAVTTGIIEQGDIVVERIHFQSLPGLYVTANLYRPKTITKSLPAVLYVCGHGPVKEDGRSMGNKTYYQHHAIWFAMHNYVCMAIDTIQLGEIEGIHHGLYSFDRWDWPSRGYTPAGVEAWNSMRAIDYLVTRPEVDSKRIGITGRSGGGAYSWYTAAIDPRISVVAPVAGITDLQDHILANCIAGHCDCMYFVNRHGWDFQTLAAMVVPRSLLIVNTDEDPIFPLPGVERIHSQVNHLYHVNGVKNLGIHWTTGGHDDTQELQLGTFVWFDRFLQGERAVIKDAAEKRFKPSDLRVFDEIPTDQRVTTVQDWFVPEAKVDIPANRDAWLTLRENIIREVDESAHGRLPCGNPAAVDPLIPAATHVWRIGGRTSVIECVDVSVPPESHCRIYTASPSISSGVTSVIAVIPDRATWEKLLPILNFAKAREASVDTGKLFEVCQIEYADHVCLAIIIPEATGLWYWDSGNKEGLHLRRSYLLAGWSVEGRQIAGTALALDYLKSTFENTALELHGQKETSLIALHAGLLRGESLNKVVLNSIPDSYRRGFNLIGILQRFDLSQTIAALADRVPVELHDSPELDLKFAEAIASIQNWPADRIPRVQSTTSK